jgi:beta-lactamase class A
MGPQASHDTDAPRRRMSARRKKRLARTASGLLALVAMIGVVSHDAAREHVAASARPSPQPTQVTPSPGPDVSGATAPAATVRPQRLFSRKPVARYLAAHHEHLTAAVFDRRTGRLYVYRAGVTMITASIVKVDILETLLARAEALDGRLGAYEEYLCREMIEESDNGAAQALWELLEDGEYVERFNATIGMGETRPDETHWGLTTTTAADQIRLVKLIAYPNHALSPASRRYALGLLTHVDPAQAWGVSAGVPAGAHVALKNGWLPLDTGWQVNSIGFVHGAGRSYAIAVLTDDEPTEPAGIDAIEGLSRLVWRQLAPARIRGKVRRAPVFN